MTATPSIVDRTTSTIALTAIPGAEYSMDGGGTWQDDPLFTGLASNTAYTFSLRMKETDNSETVILPIAGVILAFVMTLELIQLIADKNNLHDVDTWMFFRWVFKTACAILIVTNTWLCNVIINLQVKSFNLVCFTI